VAHKTHIPDSLPLREELEALAYRYRHLHNELEQRGSGSGVRRRLEDELAQVRERFGRLVEEWVPEGLRSRWGEYLAGHTEEPAEPGGIDPLVFRGVNDAGSVAEVRRRGPDEFLVVVDGALLERVEADADFRSTVPGTTFRVDGFEFRETITASPEAVRALADYLDDDGAHPPWDYASELLGDGLVDAHFGLTPRGRRALA
jgi:hypothetical protein